MASTIEQLRQEVEEKYEKALAALAMLETYISSSTMQGFALAAPSRTIAKKPLLESIVLEAIKEDWGTAAAVSERTGLSVKQVAAVLSSKRYSVWVEKRKRIGSHKEYRYKPGENGSIGDTLEPADQQQEESNGRSAT